MKFPSKHGSIKTLIAFLLCLLVAVPALVNRVTATEVKVLDDQLSIKDDKNNNSFSNGIVTIKAAGGAFSSKTNNITITNLTSVKKQLSFTYKASNYDSFSIEGQSSSSGTYSIVLESGAYINLVLKSKWSLTGSTATLELSNISLTDVSENSSITILFDASLGSVTAAGATVADGDIREASLADGLALNATANGSKFLGWIDASNGAILSTTASYTLKPTADMTVKAAFAKDGGSLWFGVGAMVAQTGKMGLLDLVSFTYYTVTPTYLFDNLNDANTAAKNSATNKAIVLMNSGTLSSGDYEISSGVTLLIPYETTNKLYTSIPELVVDNAAHVTPTAYRTLTLASGANIKVNGSMSLSGKVDAYMGGRYQNGAPSGPSGRIQMNSGSTISVESGAILYTWGYILGDGVVEIKNNGTVYECFQVRDWRGGDATSTMAGDSERVFPISQYYVQNIETTLKLNYGSIEKGVLTLYLSKTKYVTEFTFIGSDGMFRHGDENSYFTKKYDTSSDRLIIEVYGDASLSSIKITEPSELDSADYVLAINSNITVNIKEGSNVTVNQDLAILPGVIVNIEKDANMILAEGTSIYIYDKDQWGKYCVGSVQLRTVCWASTQASRTAASLEDAKIVVDGTIDASKGFVYTTCVKTDTEDADGNVISSTYTGGGANICGTEAGGGKIILTAGTENITKQVTQKDTTVSYVSIGITPAKLKNGDGSYVQSETNAYVYMNEKWMPYFMTNVSLGNNLDVYFAVLDYGTNTVTSLTSPNGDASSLELIDGTEIGLNSYKYIIYSGLAAKNMTDTVTLTVNNSILGTMIKEDSIRDYAVRMMNKHSSNTQLRTMLVDMLNYGAACQTLFDHYTNDLANAGVDGTGTTDYTLPTASDAPSNTYFDGSQLVTTGNIQFAVKATDAFTSNLIATYSYKDHWGHTISGNLKYNSTVDVPYYYIDDLVVADAKSEITITVNNEKYKDSIEAYCARMYSKSDATAEQKEVFLAFMKFSTSARNYLEGDNKLP